MSFRIPCLVLALAALSPARADEDFSEKLTPDEFQAAGLNKLTPDELAKLNALIHAHEQGAVATATAQTAQQVTARVTQTVTAQVTATVRAQTQAEDRKQPASSSFIDRFAVLLKPGTEVTYTTLEANIPPPFDGYDPGSVITLDNGQRWKVVDNSSDFRKKTTQPVHVKIVPGSLGAFFMEIEGSGRPKVKYLSTSLLARPAPTPAPPPAQP